MKLLRNLVLLALILVLVYFAFQIIIHIVFPIVSWIFEIVVTVVLLIAIGVAVIYLYRKLRS
jgi:hypothetical protein